MKMNGRKESLVQKTALRPPDGGWGWMVVIGHALSHVGYSNCFSLATATLLFIIPMLQTFTLLYRERFSELEFTSTDISTLLSLNASFGMILGVLNGPLLKIFGYRKLALVGGTLYVTGTFCTGIANSYAEFILFYGMLASYGVFMTMSAFSLATNTYFLKNRSKAIGYTMTLTGFGPILLPILISELLSSYGLKWTVFIISALMLHIFVGSLLLQPVKWHMKAVAVETPEPEEVKVEEENLVFLPAVNSLLDISICDSRSLATRFGGSVPVVNSYPWWSQDSFSKPGLFPMRTLLESDSNEEIKNWEKKKNLSLSYLDNHDYKYMMGSTLKIMENFEIFGKAPKHASDETLSLKNSEYSQATGSSTLKKITREDQGSSVNTGFFKKCVSFIKDVYDVDLLLDPFFINIILGLSIALVGEIIFSSMTPLLFKELGFNTEKTAMFMSIIAGSDLIFRFVAPYFGKKMKLNSRMMYLLSLLLLLISRAFIFLAHSFEAYIFVSFALGIGKGFRSVFWVLVIPDVVPLSKLPSALAFQSLLNGILLLISGPLTGAAIGIDNRYTNLILVSNILTFTTVILWTCEIIFLRYKNRKRNEKVQETLTLKSTNI